MKKENEPSQLLIECLVGSLRLGIGLPSSGATTQCHFHPDRGLRLF